MPHPYVKLEGTPLWNAIELAIKDLVLNKDIVESTARPYIVGYLCQRISRVEDCLRLRSMYDLKLRRGPYPTSEVSPQRFPEPEPGTISMYLADIAGVASHGEKLLNLELTRRREFRTLVAQSFAERWPDISQKITMNHTPVLRQLMNDTEDARVLIKEVLTD
jgi:hypothetical protein